MKNLIFLFVMIVGLGFTSCEKDAGPPPPPPPVDTTDTPPPVDTTTVPPVDTTETANADTLAFKFVFKSLAPVSELDKVVIVHYVSGVFTDSLTLLPSNITFSGPYVDFNSEDVSIVNDVQLGGSDYFTIAAHMNTNTQYGPDALIGGFGLATYVLEFGVTAPPTSGFLVFTSENGHGVISGGDTH